MNSRRFTLSLGVVGSGVLATAFFQAAVAAADKYDITPDPTSAGPFTAIDGMPPQDQAVAGLQYYNYQDLTTGDTGSFEGLSLHDVAASGVTNQEILALPQALAMQRDALVGGDNAPAQGSFFDTLNYGNGVENVYTDLAGTGLGSTNTISDTVVTPFGNFTMPTTFDATAALQPAEFTYPSNSAVFPGYSFVPDANDHLEIRSIGGTLPFDQSVSGIQIYDVDDATGTEVDQFEGRVVQRCQRCGPDQPGNPGNPRQPRLYHPGSGKGCSSRRLRRRRIPRRRLRRWLQPRHPFARVGIRNDQLRARVRECVLRRRGDRHHTADRQ